MLNYETILSNYDDKLTLMQWLKKVEAALNDASATNFEVVKRGDATISFKITFADGTAIESGEIILQQGESVTGGAIVNGHLILTLSNGDQIDAGSLFNGDVSINGNITAVGVHATGVKTSVISQDVSSGIDVFASVVSLNNGLEAQGTIASDTSIKTPVLTSDEAEISAQKPVVEPMDGYGALKNVDSDINLNIDFAGVAKNGNKLTFIVVGNFVKPSGSAYSSSKLIQFRMPANIGQKLVENALGGFLLNQRLALYTNPYTSTEVNLYCDKNSDTYITFGVYGLTAVPAETTQAFRIEATFLLSESLI